MTHLFRPAFGVMVASAFVWALGAPTSAHAFFGWFFGGSSGGSSGGSWGSHGSSGGSWGSSGGYYGGSSGGYYGGSSGGSGGYYGSHGSSGGSYGSSGGWGYYGGGSGGSFGGYHHQHGGGHASNSQDSQVARVVVKVPTEAKVYLQDQPMSLSGNVRKFVSPQLSKGREYEYTVRVELAKNGNTLSKTDKVRVKAGQNVEVTVNFAEDKNELVATIARR